MDPTYLNYSWLETLHVFCPPHFFPFWTWLLKLVSAPSKRTAEKQKGKKKKYILVEGLIAGIITAILTGWQRARGSARLPWTHIHIWSSHMQTYNSFHIVHFCTATGVLGQSNSNLPTGPVFSYSHRTHIVYHTDKHLRKKMPWEKQTRVHLRGEQLHFQLSCSAHIHFGS